MNINDFPQLQAAVSNNKLAKITLALHGPYKPTKARERVTMNPHTSWYTENAESPLLDDIVVGACRAEQSSGAALKPSRVHALLASSKQLSSPFIASVYSLDDRQARRYMAACKLAILMITKHQEAPVLRTRALTLAEIRAAHKGETNASNVHTAKPVCDPHPSHT